MKANKKIEVDCVIAPAEWASYLINGDHSGLSDLEQQECDTWIRDVLGEDWRVVSIEGEDLSWCARYRGMLRQVCEYVCHRVG